MSGAHYNVQTIARPKSHINIIKQIVLIKHPFFTTEQLVDSEIQYTTFSLVSEEIQFYHIV